jgi:hypothetical protein
MTFAAISPLGFDLAFLQLLHRAADFDDDAHRLVAEDVSRFHRGLVAIEEVEIGAANGGRSNLYDGLYDGVSRIDDGRVIDRVDANVVYAVPDECLHE